MDDEAFRETFRGSPMKRAKRRGLARNAALALGNGGSPEAVAPLGEAAMHHDEPLVRDAAAWALRRLEH
jgi:epoxyqueuosine reductase